MGNSGYYRPKQPVKPQVSKTNYRNHFSKSHSPVWRPIPQVNRFNQRNNFAKPKSPVKRPVVNNAVTNSFAAKGKGGLLIRT